MSDIKKLTYENATYVGETFNEVPQGEGTMTYTSGLVIIGSFLNGVAHGNCTWHFKNGNRYVGSCQNNKMHGQGVLYLRNGDQVSGNFENSFIGYGEYICSTGEKYSGHLDNELSAHGYGVMCYNNGDRKEGDWNKNTLKHGTYYDSKGDKFIIGFDDDGFLHGDGILIRQDGNQMNVRFNHGNYLQPDSQQLNGGNNSPQEEKVSLFGILKKIKNSAVNGYKEGYEKASRGERM